MYRCEECGKIMEYLATDEYGELIFECTECGSHDIIEIEG